MTTTLSFLFAAFSAVPVALLAQGSASKPAEPAATAPANPISSSQNMMYTMLSGTVVGAAQKMPEESYSFKPTPEVRSFGQLVGHLADSQYYFCGLAGSDSKPSRGIEKSTTSK